YRTRSGIVSSLGGQNVCHERFRDANLSANRAYRLSGAVHGAGLLSIHNDPLRPSTLPGRFALCKPAEFTQRNPRTSQYSCRQTTCQAVDYLQAMEKRYQNRIELLQGTLDMLILQTLRWGPQHGYGIAAAIRAGSQEVLQVETGSLYPALHRMQKQG